MQRSDLRKKRRGSTADATKPNKTEAKNKPKQASKPKKAAKSKQAAKPKQAPVKPSTPPPPVESGQREDIVEGDEK